MVSSCHATPNATTPRRVGQRRSIWRSCKRRTRLHLSRCHGSSAGRERAAASKGVPMEPLLWETNWVWGLPLIVLTSVVHVLGLGLINETVVGALRGRKAHHHFTVMFATAMSL